MCVCVVCVCVWVNFLSLWVVKQVVQLANGSMAAERERERCTDGLVFIRFM